MKQTPLKRGNSVLKSYTPLRAKTPLKRGNVQLRTKTLLRRSPVSKNKTETKKEKLDRIFSIAIRMRHANASGFCQCVTCPAVMRWQYMDCGHFQDRAHMSTRYDPRNCAPQCKDCNRFHDGENDKFAYYLDSIYGKGMSGYLRARARVIVPNFDFDEALEKWNEEVRRLKIVSNNELHI